MKTKKNREYKKFDSRMARYFSSLLTVLVSLLGLNTNMSFAIQDDYIEPPKYSTLDAFGVNVFGNTVAPTMETISMGGAMGLSHSITLQGNLFTFDHGNYGYTDKYSGGVRYTSLGNRKPFENGDPHWGTLWVLTATAMGESAQFIQKCNGLFVDDSYNTCTPAQIETNSYFEATKDKRQTLANKGNYVVWTKEDGTEVYFRGGTLNRYFNSYFQKIVYPNGFTIDASSAYSVTTNTGFELKYDFEADNRGLDATKIGRLPPDVYPSQTLSDSTLWWTKNPKYIRAINTAYEYCDQQAPCSLSYVWPTATFEWPGGMPRAFYIGKSIFRVTQPNGGVTEFEYEAQDAAITDTGALLEGATANFYIAPRLISIKPAGSSKPTVNYTYKNRFRLWQTGDGSGAYIDPSDPGKLTGASGIKGNAPSYSEAPTQHGMSYIGYRVQVITDEYFPTTLEKVTLDGGERTINFESNGYQRNFVTSDNHTSAPNKTYKYYTGTNNLQSVTDQATGIHEFGGYPANCSNPTPDRNRKTCNKPLWSKDSKGNTTSYIYHEESGQIQTITYPADTHGKSPVVRYGYEQKFAKYIQENNGTKKTAPTGIWLKTSEKTCTKGSTNVQGDSCALGASDEVIKRYEYVSDNLLMTGMTVTAQNASGDIQTLRTCYRYDRFGNLIGQTSPKANLSSCE